LPANTRDNFGTPVFFWFSMNFLKQVITLLDQHEINIDVFDEQTLENTSFHRLFLGVKSGEYSTDEEAAQNIYKTSANDPRYRNLKSRLKKKLSGSLFFLKIESSDYPEYLVIRNEIFRLTFVMRTLSSLGATEAASEIALQVLQKAQKFNLTEAAIDSLLILQNHISFSGRVQEAREYRKSLYHYREIQTAELRALEHIQEFKLVFANTKSIIPNSVEKFEESSKELTLLWNRYGTYSIFLSYFRIKLYIHQLKGNYDSALTVCNEGEDFFLKNPHFASSARIEEISLYKNLCYFYLRRYKEGIAYADEQYSKLEKGRDNWFSFMEEYFLMSLHNEQVEKAHFLFEQVISHINFNTGDPRRKETWEIFGLYLSFVEGKGNPDMDRFMKDMEVFRYDKSGVYVAVLALSILILLRNGDYATILNRDEYIKKYLARYLKGEDHVRSAAFFRLLRLIIRKEFDLPQILKTGAKDIAVLHDQSLRLDDYEVMPYEKMWCIVIEVLEEKARTRNDIPV
jgi:hypothetical protein